MEEKLNKLPARRAIPSDPRIGTDALIAELARRQDGRVTRRQLLEAGISSSAIDRRVQARQLHREHDGVYSVGYRRREIWGRFRSAWMSVGDDATIALFAAAHGHGFGAEPVVVDIACPRPLPSRSGIHLHHHQLEPWQVDRVNNLPLTSPAQTIFDLASYLSDERLAKSANEAFVVTDLTIAQLRAVRLANKERKGSTAFAAPARDRRGRRPRSPLAPLNFDRDRRRDRRCRVEGWEPVRATSRDLGPGADELDRDLRRLLGI